MARWTNVRPTHGSGRLQLVHWSNNQINMLDKVMVVMLELGACVSLEISCAREVEGKAMGDCRLHHVLLMGPWAMD